MTTLSAKIVKRPRVIKFCNECGWPISTGMLKLYGFAHYNEKPYNLFYHPVCFLSITDITQNKKGEKAIKDFDPSLLS